jgi:hypothetical protein
MGHILCNKHGGNEAVLCCIHIANQAHGKLSPLKYYVVKLDILGDKTETLEHFICEDCCTSSQIEPNSYISEKTWSNKSIFPGNYPVCSRCIAEYIGAL